MNKGKIAILSLALVTIPTVSQAHTPRACIAWETNTYTVGTYFIHHATYDTVGPIDKPYVRSFCIQYQSDVKKRGNK